MSCSIVSKNAEKSIASRNRGAGSPERLLEWKFVTCLALRIDVDLQRRVADSAEHDFVVTRRRIAFEVNRVVALSANDQR